MARWYSLVIALRPLHLQHSCLDESHWGTDSGGVSVHCGWAGGAAACELPRSRSGACEQRPVRDKCGPPSEHLPHWFQSAPACPGDPGSRAPIYPGAGAPFLVFIAVCSWGERSEGTTMVTPAPVQALFHENRLDVLQFELQIWSFLSHHGAFPYALAATNLPQTGGISSQPASQPAS